MKEIMDRNQRKALDDEDEDNEEKPATNKK